MTEEKKELLKYLFELIIERNDNDFKKFEIKFGELYNKIDRLLMDAETNESITLSTNEIQKLFDEMNDYAERYAFFMFEKGFDLCLILNDNK